MSYHGIKVKTWEQWQTWNVLRNASRHTTRVKYNNVNNSLTWYRKQPVFYSSNRETHQPWWYSTYLLVYLWLACVEPCSLWSQSFHFGIPVMCRLFFPAAKNQMLGLFLPTTKVTGTSCCWALCLRQCFALIVPALCLEQYKHNEEILPSAKSVGTNVKTKFSAQW